MYEINKIIKKIRDDNKLTQTEFAAFLSVSHQTVSSWERARTRPTLVMLKKISQ
ncbi:helix-turn-helix transcriptional regulator [Leuconostoc mesenteroides]